VVNPGHVGGDPPQAGSEPEIGSRYVSFDETDAATQRWLRHLEIGNAAPSVVRKTRLHEASGAHPIRAPEDSRQQLGTEESGEAGEEDRTQR
jgi:hypothetical protein